jgi:hypothetical protein
MRAIVGSTLLVAALASAACRTMRPVSLAEVNLVKPDRVWVTNANHSVVVVFDPQVVGDTLAGYVNNKYTHLPSAGLKQVAVRGPAPTRTVLLVVGVAAGLSGIFAVVSGSTPTQILTATSGAPGDCEKHPEEPVCTGTLSVWSY